jgi:hypothetical protein
VHPPPNNAWVQRFCGAVVDTITFCRYQIVICFEDARQIQFGGSFLFATSVDICSQTWKEFPLRESSILRVLGATIRDISINAENQLWVDFSSGDTLVVAWTPRYECYEFVAKGERVIV